MSLWRVQVLPLGTVTYKGSRELDFTREYLENIAEAFNGGALEFVPFTAEDPRLGPVNDPQRCHGEVCGVEVVSDGLDALVAVDAETDALLDLGGLPTGVRLIESYKTHGREFPVVLAMVYTTLRPVLTGLRPWTRESAKPATGDPDAT